MAYRFVVYIDESGDEGFTFRPYPDKGSSDWFVLSAVIIPAYLDHTIKSLAKNIRVALRLAPKATLHFAGFTHDKRVRVIDEIGASSLTFTSVVINKHAIQNPAIFTSQAFRLYFYTARILLERVSWYCRDTAKTENWDSCEARVIFEHRRRLSYDRLRNYLRTLQVTTNADDYLQLLTADVRIHWAAINIQAIEAAQKHDYAGLQIADCVASGIRWGLEETEYGNTEHRYVKTLRPRAYVRSGNVRSYGMKFFPQEPENCHWLNKHY